MNTLLKKLSHFGEDLMLFLLTVAGYVPCHVFGKTLYRIGGIHIGKNTSFHWRARFFRPWRLFVGSNSIIGNDAMLDSRDGFTIGDNVSLSMGV